MNELTFRRIMFLLHEDDSDDAWEAMEFFFYQYLPDDVDPDVTLIDYVEEGMYI